MSVSRWIALSLVWIAGVMTIVASSLQEEDDPPEPPVPVVVQYDLTSSQFTRELDTRSAELRALQFSGSYSANRGDTLTLFRDSIILDVDSGFVIEVTAFDEELLEGISTVEITAPFDAGLSPDPAAGTFTSLFTEPAASEAILTTVAVSTDGDSVDVTIGDGTATNYSWSDFEAAEDDADATLDLRMASAAYNMFDVVLDAARLLEDIIDDIEANETTLENQGVSQQGVDLTCDNSASGNTVHTLEWIRDAAGSGTGEIGDGDGFDVTYENCEDSSREYFLDGLVELRNYDPDDTEGFSTFGIDAEFVRLYLSETEDPTTPGATSPRIDDQLTVVYGEQAVSR